MREAVKYLLENGFIDSWRAEELESGMPFSLPEKMQLQTLDPITIYDENGKVKETPNQIDYEEMKRLGASDTLIMRLKEARGDL